MTRIIRGLKWARELEKRPSYIPIGRARGVKALGVRYERALAKALGPLWAHGRWFEFADENGLGCCQMDFVGQDRHGQLHVLEAKYTWTLEGHEQLEKQYVAVLAKARGVNWRTIGGIVVCRSLLETTRRLVTCIDEDLNDAIHHASYGIPAAGGRRVVLQWLPGTSLRTRFSESTESPRLFA